MGEMVELASNGSTARGYLARPAGGRGPGLLVIQEWWGLSPDCEGVADRLAGGGFTALAPDLYHGEVAGHDEMDKAARLMGELPPERAARDMSGAVDFLLADHGTSGRVVGVVGFCMGGMLTFLIAANRGDAVKAAVPFYGFPQGDAEPDWSGMTAVIRGHMAEHDDFFGPEAASALEAKLRGLGKDVTMTVHPGTGHAFMGPHNALGTLDEELAERIWPEVIGFLHEQLD
jgi:carboxymethylenebutenolidase